MKPAQTPDDETGLPLSLFVQVLAQRKTSVNCTKTDLTDLTGETGGTFSSCQREIDNKKNYKYGETLKNKR